MAVLGTFQRIGLSIQTLPIGKFVSFLSEVLIEKKCPRVMGARVRKRYWKFWFRFLIQVKKTPSVKPYLAVLLVNKGPQHLADQPGCPIIPLLL